MTTYLIPTINQPQAFTVQLGSTTYQMRLIWNAASNAWVLNIAGSDGVDILTGIPLVTGTDLLAPYAYLGFAGELRALTVGDETQPPTFDNLGTAGQLLFTT